MRNGYREKAIACAILHHLESYLFLWEQKKKESSNFDALCICEGDCVSVENHGKHWIHLWYIISIDKKTKTAVVKWEETRKKDTAHLGGCKKYNKLDIIPRKRKSTDFFCEIPQTKRGKPPPGQMKKHVFFWWKLVKVMRQRCHSKLTEHVAFLTSRYDFLGGNWPHQICSPSWNHWMSHWFPWLFYHQV